MSSSLPVDAATAPGAARKPTVALALGAGGAKGLAHIGAIEEIERHGYQIVAIAGTSMGALVGGIYAMGKLEAYRDWVSALAKMDVLKLVDWTFSGGGLIKGERIIGTLRELIGDAQIEDLPLAYTAVATDLDREREIWLTRGSLFDAIRASIAIPTVFRPQLLDGRRLVDGGLLNPVPVTPLIREPADYLFAVSVDGAIEAAKPEVPNDHAIEPQNGYRHRIGEFIGRLVPHGEPKTETARPARSGHARPAGAVDGPDAGQPSAAAAGGVCAGPADPAAAQYLHGLRVLPRTRADRAGPRARQDLIGRLEAAALSRRRRARPQWGPWPLIQASR